ncbi:MAG TPA: alpha/beta hydrolase [Spirochaetaceae bacterium]|nr:alpha/beta hydrolase [Spirochaetaceae bacterium]
MDKPDSPGGIFVLPEADISGIERKYLDLVYGSVSPLQKLDVYLPATGDGPFPVVMAIHGGAWMMCDKRDRQLVPMLSSLERGYAVVAVNYRLSAEAKFPAQIRDVKAAIRWVKNNGKAYMLDTGRIALWGGSAGAHLSMLAGLTSRPVKQLSQECAPLDDPDAAKQSLPGPIKAIVSWYGPTDFLMMDSYLAASGLGPCDHGAPDSPESRLLGVTIGEAPDMVRAANPERYISELAPPLFIQHGLKDSTVPYQHSLELARLARLAIGPERVFLELLEHAEHADPAFETAENLKKVMAFLDEFLC